MNGMEWVDADGSGTESVNISNTSGDSQNPSLALDSAGNPRVAWHDSSPVSNFDIYYLQWRE